MALLSEDHHFIGLSEAVRRESFDPERQVGVVIVGHSGQVIATGSNRPPRGIPTTLQESHNAIERDRYWKYFMLEHAERNAINRARDLGIPLGGATMYGTLFPCADCARAIVAADIRRLVVPPVNLKLTRDEKWQIHYHYSRQIFELSGTHIDFIS